MNSSANEVVQLSLVQIDEYGPWTVTPEPRRETDLQSLQATLYADFADFVGERDGYAFYGRFDNMFAVTNGIDTETHTRYQRRVRNRSPVTVSIGVGRASTPAEALGLASEQLQAVGSAQDATRREVLAAASNDVGESPTERVTVAHFDIVDATGSLTDRRNAVDADLAVKRATLELATYLREHHDSVAHFVGGDNVIAVCPSLDPAAFDATVEHVRETTGIDLQVGIGRGATAHEAGDEAKHALEVCRETGTRIQGVDGLAADD
ncbi:GTP cyclohydrolase IIa [Halococcus dombrowskii]|uniref:GTP cyclohydrolase III n=1 Tax=Halococcus dombrowskii TaxID=179637 RepID=A0AAX3AMV4_HALDO|nr:GTP cyclohydrolase IIa [Halococcus dombrowskii]UOO95125.1 GTP cyclohydrolase IIa [Halococcus dombrowskii]